jgi:sulfoxide reductase catalytic subunit YedY
MLIRKTPSWALKESAVTPESVYLNRRAILKGLGATGGLAGAGIALPGIAAAGETIPAPHGKTLDYMKTDYGKNEMLTPYEQATTYNNFYEFGTGKSDPSENAGTMQTEPWTVKVSGDCMKPGTYSYEDLIKGSQLEERIYRMRCVEAWSMVMPWIGVPMAAVLKRLEPTSNAKYVRFLTLADPQEMPGVRRAVLDWPYEEGLRMDEAMNELSMFVIGLYGHVLPNQNGAPIRVVTPWKYGYKSIKSIVAIEFVEKQPPTSWNKAAPNEYGFYSNVNPEVDHPRWSQATERRIDGGGGLSGLFDRQKTVKFNGYGEQVAALYKGMDLRKYH